MKGYVPGEQPREPGLIKLNTNENPYPPSPAVARALQSFDPALLRLYPDPMCTALRERIAALHGCSPEHVLVGNGSDELLALCIRALVPRRQRVGWFEPSYSLYPVLAEIEELPSAPTELGPHGEWKEPDLDGVALFFLTNPNAPTGLRFDEPHVRQLCERCQGFVAIDEAYVDFASKDLMHLTREYEHVLVFRTLSKSFSLAGLRVGYVVASPSVIEALAKLKDSYNVDRIAQCLALAALSDVDWMRRNAERIRATRERVRAALLDMGYEVWPSETNFLWIRPPFRPAVEVLRELRQRRILVRHFPGPRTGDYLRVTIGTDADMDAFLAALRDLGS
jgi:histidinol-phosphate aminotransferase